MSNTRFIFVHGLSGWGSYDAAYRWMPYWGMRGGDLIAFLRDKGYDSYAASVSPTGSAWDRTCELYAQIAGTRVDYGTVHSQTFRHERFERDFSACPLIPDWGEETRLVLIGHSFGGATVRMFAELLARTVREIQGALPQPLLIETADRDALERAMRCYNGKPLVCFADGDPGRQNEILPLLKKYGGVAVVHGAAIRADCEPAFSAGEKGVEYVRYDYV